MLSIRDEQDYDNALARIDELMDARYNTLDGLELDVLVDAVIEYEDKEIH